MRRKVDFCADWRFIREDVGIEQADEAATEPVTLPHTWDTDTGGRHGWRERLSSRSMLVRQTLSYASAFLGRRSLAGV